MIETGDTYVFAPETDPEEGYAYLFAPGVVSYVAEEERRNLGMYKLIANRRDLGDHVANASFVVDPDARGNDLGRTLGLH